MPNLHFNVLAIVVSLVAGFFLGFIWYGPFLGKTWGRLMGLDMNKKPDGAFMAKALSLQVLGLVFTTFALAYFTQIVQPAAWGMTALENSPASYGGCVALIAWLGFKVPLQLNKITWEGRPAPLLLINASYDFLQLQLIAQILVHLR